MLEWKALFTPFTSWTGELKDGKVLKADISAGITVALILIPQSMAYAQLAGLPPYYGLYAAFLPGIIAAIFGSSRQLATGPVAVVSLLTASALEPLASSNPENYLTYAVVLALFVGTFQLLLGLFRLGVLVNFLSRPVVVGFTNAAVLIIATSQIDKIFGVSVAMTPHHYETVWNTILAALDHTHMPTFVMGMLALSLLFLVKKLLPKAPAILIAVVSTTVLAWYFNFEGMGGAVVGSIPQGLPEFKLPDTTWSEASTLISSAITIALIGFMEAISIAKGMAATTKHKIDANQELVGQGLSNIVSGLSQGYAVSGSFSRSAVNINSGALTGFSSLVAGVMVGITLLWLTPLLYHLPQATLAAVIIVAVINLVRLGPMIYAWKVQKNDGFVATLTFFLTLFLAPHLENGILIGVLMSLGLFLHRTMRPRIATLARHADGSLRDADEFPLQTCPHISVMRFDMSLYFANTSYFEDAILNRAATQPELRFIIIDAGAINLIDATGEEMLHNLNKALKKHDVEFIFTRTKLQLMNVFRKTGFDVTIGKDHFVRTQNQALQFAWDQLDCAREDCQTGHCYLKAPPITR
ncbi:MAG: sulfate permease [Gammaproteobacteria bacterium]|nr:sulfate permease [Gammaproteobacteria bacterium]